MNAISRIFKSFTDAAEMVAKARVQSHLLLMGPEWVERHGYSWESLRGGTQNWPWRQTAEQLAREPEIRNAIHELEGWSERDLNDIGISRDGIEGAVRFGKPDAAMDLHQQDADA